MKWLTQNFVLESCQMIHTFVFPICLPWNNSYIREFMMLCQLFLLKNPQNISYDTIWTWNCLWKHVVKTQLGTPVSTRVDISCLRMRTGSALSAAPQKPIILSARWFHEYIQNIHTRDEWSNEDLYIDYPIHMLTPYLDSS